jgi:hypothetical protein
MCPKNKRTDAPHNEEAAGNREEVRVMRHDRLHVRGRELHVRRALLAARDARLDQEAGNEEATEDEVRARPHGICISNLREKVVEHD